MTPALEACGRKPTGRGEAPEPLSSSEPSPGRASYLHHHSVCFHYSYFMRQPGMKGSYFLHGGGQVTAGARVARLATRWGGVGRVESGFKASKQRAHKQRKNISPESAMLTLLCLCGACSCRQMQNGKKNKNPKKITPERKICLF